MASSKRVAVLLDTQEYTVLERIAQSQGESVTALVRKAVEQQYLRPSAEQRKAAILGMLSERSDLTWEDAKEVIASDVGRRLEAS